MRALRAHDLTGPDALWVDDVPPPGRPDGDAVLIDVAAAGIGFVDTLVARGRYQVRQEPPYVPGLELAGVVREMPDNAGLSVGQAVIATVPAGACAETAWAPAAFTAPLPAGLTPVQGASMVVNYFATLIALTRRAGLRAGERVLVHGAGGGLGSAFVQVAAALGATVTAVAGSPERRAVAAAAGAVTVHGPGDRWAAVRDNGGADVIVDPVGGDAFDQSLRCLASEGRLLTVGFASGRIPSAPANRLLLRNASVVGFGLTEILRDDPGLFAESAARLAELVANGLRPPPAVEYDLADGAAAFRAIEGRSVAGKTVLVVR
jgi:NADPH2:quinone reductase